MQTNFQINKKNLSFFALLFFSFYIKNTYQNYPERLEHELETPIILTRIREENKRLQSELQGSQDKCIDAKSWGFISNKNIVLQTITKLKKNEGGQTINQSIKNILSKYETIYTSKTIKRDGDIKYSCMYKDMVDILKFLLNSLKQKLIDVQILNNQEWYTLRNEIENLVSEINAFFMFSKGISSSVYLHSYQYKESLYKYSVPFLPSRGAISISVTLIGLAALCIVYNFLGNKLILNETGQLENQTAGIFSLLSTRKEEKYFIPAFVIISGIIFFIYWRKYYYYEKKKDQSPVYKNDYYYENQGYIHPYRLFAYYETSEKIIEKSQNLLEKINFIQDNHLIDWLTNERLMNECEKKINNSMKSYAVITEDPILCLSQTELNTIKKIKDYVSVKQNSILLKK